MLARLIADLGAFMKSMIVAAAVAAVSVSSLASETEDASLFDRLKDHYAFADDIQRFALGYDVAFTNPGQAFDYRNPQAARTYRITEIERDSGRYYEWDKTLWPGDFVFEFKEFGDGDAAFAYDANGVILGKRVLARGDNAFQLIWEQAEPMIGFLAVQPLFEAGEDGLVTRLEKDGEEAVIEQLDGDGHKVIYRFSLSPIRLLSKEIEADNQILHYDRFVEGDGFAYASRILLTEAGRHRADYNIKRMEAIDAIDAANLQLPTGYGPVIERGDSSLTIEEIASDLYLVTDATANRNVLVQHRGDGLTVFGAPSSDKRSEETIALINDRFPGIPVTHVYVTHAHIDHIRGLAPYVKLGATVLADAYTAEAIAATPALAGLAGRLRFRELRHGETVMGVRYYSPRNSHVKGQTFAYFPAARIIYEGDFLEIPHDNTIATHMADVERTFIEFVRAEGLQINRIVGHHRNNNISVDTMNALYDANTVD